MKLLNRHLLGATAVAAALMVAGCGGGASPNPDNDGPFTVDAEIESSDFFDSNDDRYYDIFQVEITRDGRAEVAMQSRDLDSQLFIYRKRSDNTFDTNPTAQNDDDNSGTEDSRLRFDVRRGETYRVVATSARAREFGQYRIFFSRELGRPLVVLPRQNALTAPGFDLPAIQPKPPRIKP